jgi:hypothetical protein
VQPKPTAESKNKKKSADPFSYRPAAHIAPRFHAVVTVSRRSRASVLHESLEQQLPVMEQRYSKQLKKLKSA